MKLVVDGTTDLILQVDADRQVVRLNPAGERLLGLLAIEAIGRPCAARPDHDALHGRHAADSTRSG